MNAGPRRHASSLAWALVIAACSAKRATSAPEHADRAAASTAVASPQADAAADEAADEAPNAAGIAPAEVETPADPAPTLAELVLELDAHEVALRDAGVRLKSYRKSGVATHPRRPPATKGGAIATKPSSAVRDDAEQTCSNVCGLAETICGLSDRICALARDHVDEKEYGDACERAQRDCERADEACDGCSG